MSEQRIHIAGMSVVSVDLNSASRMICADAVAMRPRVYVLVNAHSAKLRRENVVYASLLMDERKVVSLPDGVSITLAARFVGYGDIGRSPGPDLLEICAKQCAREGLPIFLLGGVEGVAETLSLRLRERYPELKIAGVATPPFGDWSEMETERMLTAIRNTNACMLWVGVSAPKQEVWAYEHISELGIPAVCVGAAFDFNIGRKFRAPKWMRKLGFEWVFRLVTEPRRMWKRYLVGNAIFLVDVVKYRRRKCDSFACD